MAARKSWIALAILIAVMLSFPVQASNASEQEIDPVPLVKLFSDVVLSIDNKNLTKSEELINVALSIELQERIRYTHYRLYQRLNKLIDVMEQLNKMINYGNATEEEAREVVSKLWSLKISLRDDLTQYKDALRCSDPVLNYMLRKELETYASILLGKVEKIYERAINLYFQIVGEEGCGFFTIKLDLDKSVVRGGDSLELNVTVEGPPDVDVANLTVYVHYGTYLTYRYHDIVRVNESEMITVPTPSVEDLENAGAALSFSENVLDGVIEISAMSVSKNTSYIGHLTSKFQVEYLKPQIKIVAPAMAYLNKTFYVNISANIHYPLSMSVYIDSISHEHSLLNTTVHPGKNVVSLSIANTSLGYHTLFFVIEPRGYYLGRTYSSALVVTAGSLKTDFEVTRIVLGPPFDLMMRGNVGCNETCIANVYVGDELVASKVMNASNPDIVVTLPFTLVAWTYTVKVSVESAESSAGLGQKVFNVYAINVPLTIILSVALSMITASFTMAETPPISFGGFKSLLLSGIKKRPKLERPKEVTYSTKLSFKKSVLHNVYRRVVKLLATFTDPPKPNETLREYLKRIKEQHASSIAHLLESFILMYEKDLYSRHRVNPEEGIKIYDAIRAIISRTRRGSP